MNLCIMGFLPEDDEDQFIKYDIDVPAAFEHEVLSLVGHTNLGEMAGSVWPLTAEQLHQIATVIKQDFPVDLEFYISVVA